MIMAASSPFCGRINIHIQLFLSEANIYQEDLDSFLEIVVVNFNGLNSTLPHCAPQVLVIFTRRGKASFFRDGADLFIPDIHSGSGQL